jgi:ribulose 1,5-bisphosphate synthetase/thiazole synthase
MGESSDSGVAELDRSEGDSAALGGRHRQHRFPAREHTVKARYDSQELAVVQQAAGAAGMRMGGYVASAALRMAQQLLERDSTATAGIAPAGTGRPAVVTDREDQVMLAELIQARLALRRYGVNLNQAALVLNSGGQAPVWLLQAVAGGDRAVARVDQAAAALARRLA